ncbi:MAG: HPF/RaiA family ribosome-associated protein [Devosia sp.]
MTLRVSGKNMDVGETLRTKAEQRFDGVIKKYFDGGYTGHLTLEPEGFGFNAVCMVHLDSGAMLQATAYGGDAISAYEILTDTIEKRLRRYNRKLKQHRHHPASGDVVEAQAYVLQAPGDDDELPDDYSPAVIAETTSNLKQLSVEEAVMELDLTQADVVVFRHAGHGGLNVVYRRADGNVGWIDPALRAN